MAKENSSISDETQWQRGVMDACPRGACRSGAASRKTYEWDRACRCSSPHRWTCNTRTEHLLAVRQNKCQPLSTPHPQYSPQRSTTYRTTKIRLQLDPRIALLQRPLGRIEMDVVVLRARLQHAPHGLHPRQRQRLDEGCAAAANSRASSPRHRTRTPGPAEAPAGCS